MDVNAEARVATIALVGALDTKSDEYRFVRDRIAAGGTATLLIDVGVLAPPRLEPDVDRDQVAGAAGTTVAELAGASDRNSAMIAMARGAAEIMRRLASAGDVDGVLIMGGSNAGFVMSQVAKALPIGFPKLLVSTIVSGDTRPYVGTTDLTMMYPVEDIAGLNSVSAPLLARAADACVGMVRGSPVDFGNADQPLVGLTMFGVTTPCVTAVNADAEAAGWEPHVFHANGTGGRTMEAMIRSGILSAVADITTTELADELLGGVCSAGPDRLTAAATSGVPQVVSVGALDMVNFGSPDTVPSRLEARLFHSHNPAVTLMRTSAQECAELGRIIATRLNRSSAFVEMHIPARGFSQISIQGQPFHDPDADSALVAALQEHLDDRIPLLIHDCAINDAGFAREISHALSRALASGKGSKQ